jgi:hypothetical protein
MSTTSVGAPNFPSANKRHPLLWPWLMLSAMWIASVFFFKPLEGESSRQVVEALSTAFLPPLIPPLLSLAERLLAACFRT